MTAVTDHAAGSDADTELRFVSVRANLLPDEIIAGRRTEVVRRRVLVGLGGLVAALVLAFGFSWWQTHSATSDLEDAQAAQTSLQQQSQRYAPLVSAKATTSLIQTQLTALMAGDVTWNGMLRTLRASAPAGVTLTQIDGTVDAGAAGAGSNTPATPDVLNQTGRAQIGTLTLTGTAKDKRTVADFADALSKVRGLGPAFVSNVATTDGKTAWTISAPLTTDALGGRYQAASAGTAKPANGGK